MVKRTFVAVYACAAWLVWLGACQYENAPRDGTQACAAEGSSRRCPDGYVCATNGFCYRAGAVASDAAAPTCATDARKPAGVPCGCDGECASSFCVSGVCCQTRCEGACSSCALPGRAGQCAPLPAGAPPTSPGGCAEEPAASCGLDGRCDGRGACRKHPDGTTCVQGSCRDGNVTGTKVCQAGQCKDAPATACAPFGCDSATSMCRPTCTNDAQCAGGNACKNGSCGPKPAGASCTRGEECESSFCADGVCCKTKCDGACVSCSQGATRGECKPVPENAADPHDVCKDQGAASCGTTGTCDGKGTCARFPDETSCGASSCSGDAFTPAGACRAGSCVPSAPVPCAPYRCVSGTCLNRCMNDADCVAPARCEAGVCRVGGLGRSCTAGAQCASGFCTDGVCCESACSGTCRSCALPTSPGRCVDVPAGVVDPRNTCGDQGAATCGRNGRCDGAGACQRYAAGTVCKAATCDGVTSQFTAAAVCDGAGTCTPGRSLNCAPFKCNGDQCHTDCSSDEQCQAPNVCTGGRCGRKPFGETCSLAEQCQSGFCAQGQCCATACEGPCRSCALPATSGTCTPLPAGEPDLGRCEGASACDGAGGCKLRAGEACAAPAECLSGNCSMNLCCPMDQKNCAGTCVSLSVCCNGTDCTATRQVP